MVSSRSLDSWCGVPRHMNWVLSWFNFNRLAHIHRPISPWRVTSFCLLPMGVHGNTTECHRHMSALPVHVVGWLQWQHGRRKKDRTEHTPLWDAAGQCRSSRLYPIDADRLRPVLPTVSLVHTVTQWSGSGVTEAYLGGQLASFSALTPLVGSSGL